MPLANPAALAFWIPKAIERLLEYSLAPAAAQLKQAATIARRDCGCGHNPYTAFYRAGEQALLEAVIIAQTETHVTADRAVDVASVYAAMMRLGARDIDGFCRVCIYRGRCDDCRCRVTGGDQTACPIAAAREG